MRPTSFLPTPSARRATSQLSYRSIKISISTHALREEGDETADNTYNVYDDFYPRPPRGGRPCTGLPAFRPMRFLPTPSARRATRTGVSITPGSCYFYPRPPRGGRPSTTRMVSASPIFLPTPSARRATHRWGQPDSCCRISTHALREEGDDADRLVGGGQVGFLPTPSARRATGEAPEQKGPRNISTHALREEGDVQFAVIKSWGKIFLPTPSARRATPR